MIIGFAFRRISAEKRRSVSEASEVATINNNFFISNVAAADFAIGREKRKGLVFTFEFKSRYEPNVCEIHLVGEVPFTSDDAELAEIQKSWKKDRVLPKRISEEVMSFALEKCNVEAILMSREVNMRPPVMMPRIRQVEGQPQAQQKV